MSRANQCLDQSKRIQNLIIADIHLTDNENSCPDCGLPGLAACRQKMSKIEEKSILSRLI